MINIYALILLLFVLTGCSAFDEQIAPREFDCIGTCEGCEKCVVDCRVKGQGRESRNVEVKGK